MKSITFKFLALVLGLAPAFAPAQTGGPGKKSAAVAIPNQDQWAADLKATCIETTRRNNGASRVKNVEEGCACMARNSILLALQEDTVKDALEDLEWTKRFLQDKISDREMNNDPLSLADLLFAFGDACAKNPAYRHAFGEPKK